MRSFVELCAGLAVVLTGLSSLAYNGGYENGLLSSTTIGDVAYKGFGNKTVTAREAGDTGATIAANRYAQCKALKSVDLTGVTTIGDAAFAYSALTSVDIPATVARMGFIAFGGCTNLTSVTLNSTSFMSADDEVKEPFRGCSKLTTVTAKCAPPSWNFTKIFPHVTTVRCASANLASWKAKYPSLTCTEVANYMIRFIRNDGAGTLATNEFACGDSTSLPTVAQLGFARRGYAFGGWATTTANARNGVAWKQDGAAVKDATTAGKMMDVYAIWKLKSDYYEIRFEKNDGTGKWRALGYAYGTATTLPSIDAGLGWSRPGYTFKGWATSATGAVWKGDKAAVSTAAAKGKTLVIYAIWEKACSSYSIRFVRNDGAGTLATNAFACGVSVALPTVAQLGFARRGYAFGGWATTTANARNGIAWRQDGAAVKDATTAGKMLDVYAIWKLKSDYYEIRLEKNDGTGKWRALGYEYGKATALPSIDAGLGWARAGYTFKGWSTSATGAVWKGDKATVATAAAKGKTLVIYAIWAKSAAKSAVLSSSAEATRSAASAKASTNVGATENSETTSDCLAGELATGDGTYLLWLDPDPSTGVLLVMPLEGDPVCEPVTLTERGQALTDRGQTLEAETVGGEVYWLAR